MANSIDPDELALYKLSHWALHCLHRHLRWSAGLKGLKHSLWNCCNGNYKSWGLADITQGPSFGTSLVKFVKVNGSSVVESSISNIKGSLGSQKNDCYG